MKVTVILPVYNGQKTLSRTLESLLSQTYDNFELLVCIDGSTDNSLQIIKEYESKFKKVTVLINHKNLGLGPTMNRLVSQVESDYIAIAEQDDFYYPERLALEVAILDGNSNVGLVSGIADFWDGDKIVSQFPGLLVNGKQYPKGKELFLLNYKHQIKVVNSCIMFRKVVHIENGLYFSKHYPSVSIDWSYILRFSMVSEIYGIPKSLVQLDRSVDRNSVTSNKFKQYKAARELIQSFYYEYPDVISENDYKFAMTTQHLLELGSYNKYQLPLNFIKVFIKNPGDKRWFGYLKKRLKLGS